MTVEKVAAAMREAAQAHADSTGERVMLWQIMFHLDGGRVGHAFYIQSALAAAPVVGDAFRSVGMTFRPRGAAHHD